MIITLLFIVNSVQGLRFKRADRYEQVAEECFKEANITDPIIKSQALNNGETSYSGKAILSFKNSGQ